MIIFNEGLPRAGKSYDAVKRILEALQVGRRVFSNIDGLQPAAFATMLNIKVEDLLGDSWETEIEQKDVTYVDINGEFVDVYESDKSGRGRSAARVSTRTYFIPESTPPCPNCGKLMTLRKAREFKRNRELYDTLEQEFWGCMSFPMCRGTKPRAQITKYFYTQFSGLLFLLKKRQVPELYNYVSPNSLLVIDECQKFWPQSTSALNDKITEFVSEHGHLGIDIILMGQAFNDVHYLWKNRIDKLIHFTKLDAVGMDNHFRWESFKKGNKGFVSLKKSVAEKYDPKFFPLYKSHYNDDVQKGNYADDRANILKSKLVTIGLPAFIFVLCFALYNMYDFLKHPPFPTKQKTVVPQLKIPSKPVQPVSVPVLKPVQPVQPVQPVPVPQSVQPVSVPQPVQPIPQSSDGDPVHYFKALAKSYKLRIGGMAYFKDNIYAYIDVYDGATLKERFNTKELKSIGFKIKRVDYGIVISHEDDKYLVRNAPMSGFAAAAASTSSILLPAR